MKPDILVIRQLLPDQMAQLEASYTVHRYDRSEDPDALLAEVGDKIEAVVTIGGNGLTKPLLEKLPNLKIASLASVGYDAADLDACNEHGVTVTNTPDVLTNDVADIAIGLLIATRRDFLGGDKLVRSGDWAKKDYSLQSAIAGKKLGIAGLGRIGKAIAARGEVMGMEIGYYSRNKRDDIDYAYSKSILDLAQWCDVLVAAMPGGASTAGIVSKDVIEALGPTGTFINIARGSVVDEPALIAALKEGRLGSAGLDVYLNEPNPDPAFAELDNVVLLPHVGSATTETRAAMCQLVVDNFAAHFAGKPLLTPVN